MASTNFFGEGFGKIHKALDWYSTFEKNNCFTKATPSELLAFVWDGGPKTEVRAPLSEDQRQSKLVMLLIFQGVTRGRGRAASWGDQWWGTLPGQDCELQLGVGGERSSGIMGVE